MTCREAVELRLQRILAYAAVVALAATAVLMNPVTATHAGSGHPDCVNTVPAAEPAAYDVARVRTEGYASGNFLGVDLRLVDHVTPAPVPDVFEERRPAPVTLDMNVAGALVSLAFPGLQNAFLLGGAPVTEVKEHASPLDASGAVTSHAGAQTLSAIFNGRITAWAPESFTCESVERPGLLWTFTIQRIALDGYATALTDLDDDEAEPWGTAFSLAIGPGDTASR